jgi:hypothetical protein
VWPGQRPDSPTLKVLGQANSASGCKGLEGAGFGGAGAKALLSPRLFPAKHWPRGRGRGLHLTARTNFPLQGARGSRWAGGAQLSPNGEVCKQKRAPRGSPSRVAIRACQRHRSAKRRREGEAWIQSEAET